MIATPMRWNSLEEGAAWLTKQTNEPTTPANIVDYGARGNVKLHVAIPTGCLKIPKGDGYGISTWPIDGLLDFSPLECHILQAQGKVLMNSARLETHFSKLDISFVRTVKVTVDMLRVSRSELERLAERMRPSPPPEIEEVDVPDGEIKPPKYITRNAVMSTFPVKSDPDDNFKFWDDRLGKPPKWLKTARGEPGRPGTSSLWKPLVIAHCLLEGVHKKPFMTLRQLDTAIHKCFPEQLIRWQEETQDKR